MVAAVEVSVTEAGEESPGFIGQGAVTPGGESRRKVQQRVDRLIREVRVKGCGKSAPRVW